VLSLGCLYEKLRSRQVLYKFVSSESIYDEVGRMTHHEFKDELTARIVAFLTGIGLEVSTGDISEKTFLPGIFIDRGVLIIDESKLEYPGDLLHEAGHLTVIPSSQRGQLELDVSKMAADEMMAIAWSYAALVHIGLEPSVVFHPGGYRGGSQSLIDNFTQGRYFGVPMLQWVGMTAEGARAKEMEVAPYPNMIKWLRE